MGSVESNQGKSPVRAEPTDHSLDPSHYALGFILAKVMNEFGLQPIQDNMSDLARLQNQETSLQGQLSQMTALWNYLTEHATTNGGFDPKAMDPQVLQTMLKAFQGMFKPGCDPTLPKLDGITITYRFKSPDGSIKTESVKADSPQFAAYWAEMAKNYTWPAPLGSMMSLPGDGKSVSGIQAYIIAALQARLDTTTLDLSTPGSNMLDALNKIYSTDPGTSDDSTIGSLMGLFKSFDINDHQQAIDAKGVGYTGGGIDDHSLLQDLYKDDPSQITFDSNLGHYLQFASWEHAVETAKGGGSEADKTAADWVDNHGGGDILNSQMQLVNASQQTVQGGDQQTSQEVQQDSSEANTEQQAASKVIQSSTDANQQVVGNQKTN